MRTLAIETASEACSVALFEGADVLASDHQVLGRGPAESLVPMISALPNKGKADRILVSLGPGSFTGVRIGLATARALSVAWKAKVVGYPTLRLIAGQAQATQPRAVTVCVNAGHGELFMQNFAASGQSEGELASLTPDQARDFPMHDLIAGNRATQCAALTEADTVALTVLPDAQYCLGIGPTWLMQDLRPIYGRAPDATPQKSQAKA